MRAKAACLVAFLLVAACSEPDYAPLRADLAKSAEVVCAPPPARPPYGAKTRDVPASELDDALRRLCASDDPLVPEAWAVVKEALADPRAIVGEARKRQHRLHAGIADRRCDSGKLSIERKLLFEAEVAGTAGQLDAATDRCADAFAVVRESLLTGNAVDAVIASENLDAIAGLCARYLETAPKTIEDQKLDVFRTLRATLPRDLHDVLVRDRAELTLFTMGPLRDRSTPLPCERANALASANDGDVTSRSDRYGVYQLWQKSRATPIGSGAEKYETIYADALWKIDVMLRR